jgi:isopenicillin N synthase-like dioxygenase
MHGPNPWPDASLLPGWSAAVQAYFQAALRLSRAVAKGLALALGLPEAFFMRRRRDPVAQLLLLRYPPSADEEAAKAAVGCSTHTDCGFLTILAQDDVPGLEVMRRRRPPSGGGGPGAEAAVGGAEAPAAACHRGGACGGGALGEGGEWLAAPPLPGALLVNLGDLAEYWSGGVFRSTPHRVFIAPGAARAARHSVVFFCNCDFDAEVAPLAPGAGGGEQGGGEPAGGGEAATTAGHYILKKLGLMYMAQP